MKKHISWVCIDCGNKYGRHKCGISTWHEDTCGICGKRTSVTQPRDFGYLKKDWYERKWAFGVDIYHTPDEDLEMAKEISSQIKVD